MHGTVRWTMGTLALATGAGHVAVGGAPPPKGIELTPLGMYLNTRNFSAATGTGASGDLDAEAARVIPAEQSPLGVPLLLTSNEVSGTLRVFSITPRR